MTAMSAGIAVLGLLLSSPAVVIGAMLLSPLMGPIMGLGFALAIGDYKWLRKSALALIAGCVMAIGLCAAIVFASPIQTVTTEIASRTQPNLFDLLVALFSSLAGAYATIRGREGTIVGVAIATALMPPLAVVGFGLATANWTVFSGASLLFVTNAVTIALTAMVMARIYGFYADLSQRQTQMQNLGVLLVFVLLAIPLGFSLVQIGREANGTRQVRGELQALFDDSSRLSQVDIDWRADPVAVTAMVLTPSPRLDAETVGTRTLSQMLDRPVELRITQYQVGVGGQAAEAAEISAAQAKREASESALVEGLSRDLALVAGVSSEAVTVDRGKRRAVVRARPLPGATLATYRALETRIAGTASEWTVVIEPPAGALPQIAFAEGEPTDAGRDALDLVAWAAQRSGRPIRLVGPRAQGEKAAALLAEKGVTAAVESGPGPLRARWVDGV